MSLTILEDVMDARPQEINILEQYIIQEIIKMDETLLQKYINFLRSKLPENNVFNKKKLLQRKEAMQQFTNQNGNKMASYYLNFKEVFEFDPNEFLYFLEAEKKELHSSTFFTHQDHHRNDLKKDRPIKNHIIRHETTELIAIREFNIKTMEIKNGKENIQQLKTHLLEIARLYLRTRDVLIKTNIKSLLAGYGKMDKEQVEKLSDIKLKELRDDYRFIQQIYIKKEMKEENISDVEKIHQLEEIFRTEHHFLYAYLHLWLEYIYKDKWKDKEDDTGLRKEIIIFLKNMSELLIHDHAIFVVADKVAQNTVAEINLATRKKIKPELIDDFYPESGIKKGM